MRKSYNYLIDNGNYYHAWNAVFSLLVGSCMALASLLAMVQFMTDYKPELQAYIRHRPIQPRVIFWSKATVGLTLYLLGTSIPLAGFAIWARQQGHIAGPFDMQLLLPSIGLILTGVAAYFAATTVQFFGWVCLLSIAIYSVGREHYSAALFIRVIAIILLAIAAQSSYSAFRAFQKQRLIGRIAVGAMRYISVLGVCLVILISAYSSRIAGSTYEATEYGQTVICTGVTFGALDINKTRNGVASQMQLQLQNVAYAGHNYDWLYSSNTSSQHYVVFIPSKQLSVVWRYSRSKRQIFEYSQSTNLQIGVLGPNGFFLADGTKAGRFPASFETITDSMAGNSLLVFKNQTYWIDTKIRQAHAVAIPHRPYVEAPIGNDFLALTQRRFITVDKNGKLVFAMPFPAMNPSYTIWRAAITPHGRHIYLWGLSESQPNLTTMLWEFSRQGRLQRVYHLSPTRKSEATFDGLKIKYLMPWTLGLFVPGLHYLVQQNNWMSPAEFCSDPVLATRHSISLLYLVIIGVSGLVNSLLVFIIARRCGYARYGTGAWIFGAFFLGLPGVMLMLALCNWPAREVCHNCHKKRVVTREHCEHCGAPWAASALDGTEIFEGGIML